MRHLMSFRIVELYIKQRFVHRISGWKYTENKKLKKSLEVFSVAVSAVATFNLFCIQVDATPPPPTGFFNFSRFLGMGRAFLQTKFLAVTSSL